MSITAAQVKELRERTGVAMMECKKALVEADGNIDTAIELMRKSGMAKAAKKSSRIAAEGAIVIALDANNKSAAIVEINSETDFVARDDNFRAFADKIKAAALTAKTSDIDVLLAVADGDATLEEARKQLVVKIGENINVRRANFIQSDDIIGHYSHGDRIGVVVSLQGGDAELAKDVAMHIAAMKPQVVSPEEVPSEMVEKEKEIFTAQALESGKPAEIIEKMIGGRIKKYLNEVSLTGQEFVKDPSLTVGKLLADKKATVTSFTFYEVGEGIEKKEDNFREEVMAQVQGSN
jgi:elongation factor Ts